MRHETTKELYFESRGKEIETKMSHAEIWDDSALVNSWNEALEEYKVNLLST
jgi:hypothetical protein